MTRRYSRRTCALFRGLTVQHVRHQLPVLFNASCLSHILKKCKLFILKQLQICRKLQKHCKEVSCTLCPFLSMVASTITVVQYQDQETDVGTMRVQLCIIFSHVQVYVSLTKSTYRKITTRIQCAVYLQPYSTSFLSITLSLIPEITNQFFISQLLPFQYCYIKGFIKYITFGVDFFTHLILQRFIQIVALSNISLHFCIICLVYKSTL